jgi:CDGSH-type Zn-finger protein
MSADDQKPSVTPMPNGPYVVKGLPALANQKGPIEMTKSTIALCRCGKSESKPFCDGAHSASGFSSDKEEDRRDDTVDSYDGNSVTIEDNRGVCAHSARCTESLPEVFRYGQEPWIDPSGATQEEIASVVNACPSGALRLIVGGSADESRDEVESPAVFVAPNGPYVVTGAELTGAELGTGATPNKLTLCRCGHSKNKPFCDGSHWDGFVDEEN